MTLRIPKYVFSLLLLGFATPSYVFGAWFPELRGRLSNGADATIVFDIDDISPDKIVANIYIAHKNGEKPEATETYLRECVFSELTPTGRYLRTLTCNGSGKSPFAGTRYIARKTKQICEQGGDEYIYTCVSGCRVDSGAPRKLTRGFWEC